MKSCLLAAAVAAALVPSSWDGQAAAQTYDPRSQSPLTLTAAPADALAYRAARLRAQTLLDADRAAEAEPLAERLVRDYPRDGDNWLLLGSVREKLGKFAEAAAANERAGELMGTGLTEVPFFRAARNHLAAGNRRAALDLVAREVRERRLLLRSEIYNAEELSALRSDPEFRELFGVVDTTGWSRDYGWRRDAAFLRDEVARVSPMYHGQPLPAEFERLYDDLLQNIPRLSDEQILVEMNRLLATLRQGHTWLRTLSGSRIPQQNLPFSTWVFPEGLFIVSATPAHQDLIGSQLVAIEGVPAEELLRRANATQSVDGDNQYLLMGPELIGMVPYLRGLGVRPASPEMLRITVRSSSGRPRTVSVRPGAHSFSLKLPAPPNVPAPLYLRDVRQSHWEMRLPEHDALYVQLNQVLNDPDETLPQFGVRLREVLASQPVRNLVIDMRHNTGGTTAAYPEFLRTVIGFSQQPGRRVYVLTGRATYSAAANLITDLERLVNPVFVGEAASECCALNGDPSSFTLPFSRIRGEIAALRWNLSRNAADGRREISPQAPVVLSARDYFAGRDPVMDTVFRLIAADAPATDAQPSR